MLAGPLGLRVVHLLDEQGKSFYSGKTHAHHKAALAISRIYPKGSGPIADAKLALSHSKLQCGVHVALDVIARP